MRAGKVAMVVTGSLAAILSAGLLAGAVWIWNANTESGYLVTHGDRIETVTYGFAAHQLDVDSDVDWLLDRGPKLRVSVEGSQPLFVGIAPTHEVVEYLGGAVYDEVTDFSVDPFRLTTERHAGTADPAAPAGLDIWAASVQGTGVQTLDWDGERGGMSVVVMNADASAGVDAELKVGAHIPHLTWIGLGGGIAGAVLGIAAIALLYAGARPSRRDPLAPTPAAPLA